MGSGECILPPTQYHFLCKTSCSFLIASIYAFYQRQPYDISVGAFLMFLTSINYWRKPDYSWRRYVDMVYVKSAIVYQLFRAYGAEYSKEYYIGAFVVIWLYPIGIILYKKRMYWTSTYVHGSLHILGNIFNIILYSGAIVPFQANPFFARFFTPVFIYNSLLFLRILCAGLCAFFLTGAWG